MDKYEHVLAQVNAVAMERLIDPKTQVNILDVCGDPTVMAQQLTHIELVRERDREREEREGGMREREREREKKEEGGRDEREIEGEGEKRERERERHSCFG